MRAVCSPAPVTREPGSEPSTCFAGAHSPWPPPFAPPTPLRPPPQTPPQGAFLTLFAGFISISASVPHLPDADRPSHTTPDGQTPDLPGSGTIPLHVMWPLTPAGRRHLAYRCLTCCLRANENPRPLRCLIFRGSIPHPMQSLCTLRNHCRQWPPKVTETDIISASN